MGRVSKYSEEFRRQAAMLVVDGGRGVRDVARELDVNHETLRNWVGALKRERATPGGPVSGDERAELARLRRRVAELELEKDPEKSRGLLRAGDGAVSRGAIFGFIAAEKTTYGVRRLCRVLGVAKTAFYDWAARAGGPTPAELAEAYAIHAAHQAWLEHRRVYGARRLTAEIRDRGHRWNRKRVARLMRLGGIEGIHRRRRGKYGRRTASTATAADLVERRFTAPAPDQLWVADITYLRTWEGFLYLAVVVDACTRRVVGWAMADHLRTELVLDAVGMALFARKPAPGLVHHSDRGSQYTSYEFGKTLRTSGLLASMGRVGSAFDNAMAESFFATLKAELVYRRAWPTRHELEMEVFSYIEGFYNPRRRHSRLDNLSPADFEKMLMTQNEASA